MIVSIAPTCGIALKDIGSTVELVDLGQGYKDFAPCVSNFIEAAVSGKLRHGGHPVLTAAVMGAAVVQDPAGNLKVDKGKSEGSAVCRIDPAVAAIMAVGGPRPEAPRDFKMMFINRREQIGARNNVVPQERLAALARARSRLSA